jgi:hypothetical protein
MKKLVPVLSFVCCVLPLCAQEKEDARLKEYYDVLNEMLAHSNLKPSEEKAWKDTKTRGLCKTGHQSTRLRLTL